MGNSSIESGTLASLRLAGLKAILCGAFVVLAGFAASAADCPLVTAPGYDDKAHNEIVGTDCYIGHDEPIVSFYSTVRGSASNVTWEMILPAAEKTATAATYATNAGTNLQSYQNYAHFQFYFVLCDPDGTGSQGVQVPCTPNSDTNAANVGAALLELKFIPPGEPTTQPFGGYNCSNRTTSQWCSLAQIQIDNTCAGSPNFNEAWITTNGQPPQPVFGFPQQPAPANTLLMAPGDKIRVLLTDSANGLLIVIVDETSHTTGYVQTSAANGFTTINPVGCATNTFTFRPLWNTATSTPAHGYTPFSSFLNVAWGLEIGHGEASGSAGASGCATTTNVPTGTFCFGQDTDVDGGSYVAADWPPGANAPSSSAQLISAIGTGIGPVTSNQLYPTIRFTAGSSNGAGSAAGAAFYPYYSILQPDLYNPAIACALVIGNFAANGTTTDFGKLLQYGTPAGVGPTRNRPC
jgi:hypothetical protein